MHVHVLNVLNVLIGSILLILAILHSFIPNTTLLTIVYALGAAITLLTLHRSMSIGMARVLAVMTTALMFFYFAGFFKLATHFDAYWYRTGASLEAVGLLLAAFAMIPVLSAYSCLLKADCREAFELRKRRAFFSVPQSVEDQIASS